MKDSSGVLKAFSRVRSFVHGDKRAPHKPILLLLALAGLQRGERWVRFAEIEQTFRDLFLTFGPYRAAARPEFPFWRLQNDGLWMLPLADILRDHQNASGDVPITKLRAMNAEAGFTDDLYQTLQVKPELANAVAAQILAAGFPPSTHQELLDAAGVQWRVVARRSRSRGFREEILRIFERRCAVCGYDGRLGVADLGLEAGHIKWHAAGGPDSPDNGVALCSFHHVALDRGAMTIDERLLVRVSQDVAGHRQVETMLLQYSGRPLIGPQSGSPKPNPEFLAWHQEQVFRSPARVVV